MDSVLSYKKILLGLKKASPLLKDSCINPLSTHTESGLSLLTTNCWFVSFHCWTEYNGVCAKWEEEEGREEK